MIEGMRVFRGKGGNRHPLSPRQFILDHLATTGEDYVESMHRAFKNALAQLAADHDRHQAYHVPTYSSFRVYVGLLTRDGLIEPSGREEESSAPQFAGAGYGWLRRYYRLKRR
jgi:hypothetical protein